MGVTKLAVMGAGSVRCMPSTVAALCTYFGERPLEVRLFDADQERLELLERFTRGCCLVMDSTHQIMATIDPAEALDDVNGVIFHVGRNCARKMNAEGVEQALEKLGKYVPEHAEVLSLQPQRDDLPLPFYRYLDSPKPLTEAERVARAFQILRWLHGEESVMQFLGEHERSPLKAWLNDPESVPLAQFG